MKKKILLFIISLILISIIILLSYYFISNNENKMQYKFENDKLYITVNSKDWTEVPYDFSYTIKHLNETNNGEFKDNTYQMTSQKIAFYTEIKVDDLQDENFSPDLKEYLTQNIKTILVYSDDGGKTWKESMLGLSPYFDTLIYINFKDSKNGEITLKSRDNQGSYNYITTDGGQNWETK